jgi:dihydrolipoamide dehydrogenase
MVVGEVAEGVDLLVVGGGPGGYTAALRAAQLGRQVTLVDRDGEEGIGGVCLRIGCIPSKALIEVAELHSQVAHGAERGLVGDVRVALPAFQDWKNAQVDGLTAGVRQLLSSAGVRVLQGTFRFTRPGSGVVRDGDGPPVFLEYRDVVLATGSRPMPLQGIAFDGERILDSSDVLALDEVPGRVAIIGGGYIGIELGTALAKLGSSVTIVEMAERLLPAMDGPLSRPVAKRLDQLGVRVRVDATASAFDEGELEIVVAGETERITVDRVVVAVGRVPNTDELGLDTVGIRVDDRGLVIVDDDRRAAPHVAAIGDITAGPALAHKASAEAIVAAEALCGKPAAFAPAAIPLVVFSDPEVASAGLTVDEATAAGITVSVHRFPLAASGRAATVGSRDGFAQLIVDAEMDAVVGVHIVAPHASELIAEAVLAIEMAASPYDLAASIHPHPTFSELVTEVAHLAIGVPLHVRSATGRTS